MKALTLRSDRRALFRWGAGVVLLLALSLRGSAGGDGTIGTLPSAEDGDGSQTMFVACPLEMLEDVVAGAMGDGFYVQTIYSDGSTWVDFFGDVWIRLDEQMLRDYPEDIQFGITSGFTGGGMVALPEVGGVPTDRTIRVSVGSALYLPYTQVEPLLDADFALRTVQFADRHEARITFDSYAGYLTLGQTHH